MLRAELWSTRVRMALRTANVTSNQFVEYVSPWLSQSKRKHIEQVAQNRIAEAVCVIEGLYDLNNVGDITRSAEAFGITDICIINMHRDRFKKKRTNSSVGAKKWVNYSHFDSTEDCIRSLKATGFHVTASHPLVTDETLNTTHQSKSMYDMDWNQKIAVVVGNDFGQLSDEALTCSDSVFHIPTTGFSKSLDVTAASTIVFHELSRLKLQQQTVENSSSDNARDHIPGEIDSSPTRNFDREAEIYGRILLSKGVPIEDAISNMDQP